MPLVLGQLVGDREPRRLRAHEDVVGRADGRRVDQGAHGHVDVGAVADDRIKQRAAPFAVRIVSLVGAVDQQAVGALRDREFGSLDAGEGLEGRAGGAPAVRAVAVHGVEESVGHAVLDGAAEALSGEEAIGHGVSPFASGSLYTNAMSSLDSMPGPTSRHFISQRLRMHYVDWGNPDAPPLLLVHGGRDHCRNWDWVAQALRHDWHIICPDLRGHGDSQWSPDGNYSMSAYIYDLAQLIHQQSLVPVTIVAHSLGGNICLRYTGIYPDKVRKLVAIEGLGPSPKAIAERGHKGMDERVRSWVEEQRKISGR